MQQDPNLQAPFNVAQNEYQQNVYGAYPSQDGYPQNSRATYPQSNPYNGYQQNGQGVQPGYPLLYNTQSYQQAYPGQPQTQVVIAPEQMQAMTSQNAAYSIESRIITGFCCYSCLVYFELIVSLCTLIFGIVVEVNLNVGAYIALNVSSAVVMFVGCILALLAKANFDRSKQYWAFIFFIIATILAVTTTVLILIRLEDYRSEYEWCYNYPYEDSNYYRSCDEDIIAYADVSSLIISFIAAIPFQLLIGLGLICTAYSLMKLMKQRDDYLEDAKRKLNSNSAIVIAA